MTLSISKLFRRLAPVAALCALVVSMDGSWATAQPVTTPAPRPASAVPARPAGGVAAASTAAAGASRAAEGDPEEHGASKPARKIVTGKLNLNTATEEQLTLLPTVGPSKA